MKKKLMSFAHGEEDLLLFHFLDEIENGFYVDVGANDPWSGSVTKLFYNLGWSGINIEPLPDMYDKLCQDRSRDININCGAGDKEETLELYVMGGLSTFDESTAKTSEIFTNLENKIYVKIRHLTDIISENIDINTTEIHFCKIDVENFEKEVLLGLNLDLIRPWIFCIESTEPYSKISTHEQWEDILLNNNYYLLCNDGVNRYYADSTKKSFFESKDMKNFNEKYEIYVALEKTSKIYTLLKFVRKHFIHFYDLYYRIRFRKF